MNVTDEYTRMHAAFQEVARVEELAPFDVRVLLAVADRGGSAVSDELEAVLAIDGSSIRRSLLILYTTGHAYGVGADGGRRRQGTRTRVSLTPRGLNAVRAVGQILGIPVTLEVAA